MLSPIRDAITQRTVIAARLFSVRRRSLLIALLAGVAVGGSAGTAHGLSSDFFGVNYCCPPGAAVRGIDVNRLHQGHVGSIRWHLSWASVQPSEGGPIDWTNADQVVGAFASRG